jgi:hypothetical protein
MPRSALSSRPNPWGPSQHRAPTRMPTGLRAHPSERSAAVLPPHLNPIRMLLAGVKHRPRRHNDSGPQRTPTRLGPARETLSTPEPNSTHALAAPSVIPTGLRAHPSEWLAAV